MAAVAAEEAYVKAEIDEQNKSVFSWSWCFHGVFVVFSWCFRGVFVVFSCCFRGVFVVFSCCFCVLNMMNFTEDDEEAATRKARRVEKVI